MASSSFDPFTQNVTFHYMDGTPFNVSIIELNSFVQYDTKISINYGSQIGASLVLLIILALMTKPERRKAPVCILNASALMFNVARLICMCIYFTSPFSELYSFFAGDYSRVPSSAYATSIMGVILTFFLLVCLEASLVLQVRVICSTARPLYRHLVLAASLVVAVVALGFRAAFVVQNSKFIAAAEDFSPFVWLQSVTNIAITVSVCFFSGVFIIKLGYAIRQRRQLGFKKFGPMQVIFIMGCQTMVVPAICSVMQYFTAVPEMSSNVLTLVAISLPLSSMWATAALENSHDTTDSGKFWASSSSNSSRQYTAPLGTSHTECSLPGSLTHPKPMSATDIDRHRNMYPDLEAGDVIQVDRQFSVASYRQ